MKTLFITAALSAISFISANGQEVARFTDFGIVPSTLTSNGKAIAVGLNENEGTQTAYILDDNLKAVKQFNLKTTSYTNRKYDEIATVKPSGAEIEDYYQGVWVERGETYAATDLNSMINILSNVYYDCNFYGFTDSKGRVSCWAMGPCWFYHEDWFGTMYPERYFAIVDGVINEISVSYKLTFTQSDIDNAEWTYYGGNGFDASRTETAESFGFYDYDTNIYLDGGLTITQSLFNDDDKWEYILPQYGQVEKTVSDYIMWSENENGVIFKRDVSESQSLTGWTIYNEDGNKIAPLNCGGDIYREFNCIRKLAGNIYLQSYEDHDDVVYKYDPKSTSVQEISRSKSKSSVVKVNGRSFRIKTNGENVDEAVLVDMVGRKVASSRNMDGENLTINAANVPKGVYNVALKNRGKVTGAQKIIIK